MRKIIISILVLVIVLCQQRIYSQDNVGELKITKIKETKSIDEYKTKYKIDKEDNKVLSFEHKLNTLKSGSNNSEIVNSFNAKKISPDSKYFVAYFDGEIDSKYIGFFDESQNLINYHEVNIEPSINFSETGNYLVVYSLFQSDFFIFNRKGALIFRGDYKKILPQSTLYNIFIDDIGKSVVINTAYQATMYNIQSEEIEWSQNLENILIRECVYNSKENLIYTKSLLKKENQVGNDKYSLEILSEKSGKVRGKIPNVSKMYIKDKNILINSKNKWQEYEIK